MADIQALLPTISTVITKTADHTITAVECNGRFSFTNDGTTSDGFAFTLPSVTAGLRVVFIVADAKILQVNAAGEDTIRIGADEGEHIFADTAGDTTELIGINSTEWFALDQGVQFSVLSAKGYILGGYTGNVTAVIEELVFSTESSAAIGATLDDAKNSGIGVNSSIKGYVLGGLYVPVAPEETDAIEELVFSDESSAAIVATLDTARSWGAGCNSLTKGYLLGGYPITAVIEQLTFSNETSAAIVATLDDAREGGAGVNSTTKGYILGGYDSSIASDIEQLTFSNETSAAIVATLATAKDGCAGTNSSIKGYVLGGDTGTGAVTAVIEQLTFSAETSAAIVATLDTAKDDGAGLNSPLKGYILGGDTGGIGSAVTAAIEQLTFSDDSSAAIGATLDTAKSKCAGVNSGAMP